MQQQVDAHIQEALQAIDQVDCLQALTQVKAQYLGKKGVLSDLGKQLNQATPEERPSLGKLLNQAKNQISAKLEEKSSALQSALLQEKLATETIDVTLPGRGAAPGTKHPIHQTRERIESIFQQLGFAIEAGPEIEDDYHNFTALNIPEYHPARAMQDTFYCENDSVLRTHTSPVQIRYMETHKPPLRIISAGRVYRHDFDQTHTPMFHQLEGLCIDKQISFAHLKHIIDTFITAFFDEALPVRFRPSYFPFTEPSAEIDIACVHCEGKGCRLCGNTGWLEVAGCGMVHPNVLKAAQIDPKIFSGYAFGFGYDRLTMLRYGVTDLRSFFESDLKFLKQFS